MNSFSRLVCASVLLFSLGALRAESYPVKALEPPKFFVGCPVIWSDGSRGKIMMRPDYRNEEWYYQVQLGGENGLCWSLPERGLKFNQNAQ